MPLLEATHYRAVRAAIDLALTEEQLLDEVIAESIFQGRAERDVLLRDPDATTYTETGATAAKWAAVRNAAVFLTAAYLAPRLPQIIEERFADGASYRARERDLAMLVGDLKAAAEAEFATYLEPADEPPWLLPGLVLLGGGRDG